MAYVEKSPNQPLFLDLGHLIVDGEQPPDIIRLKNSTETRLENVTHTCRSCISLSS